MCEWGNWSGFSRATSRNISDLTELEANPMNSPREQAPLTGAFRRCKAIMEAPARIDTEDLRSLADALRKLQRPYEKIFWDLQEQISRIEDEIERRTS
jgi:hypothetical protein